MALGATQPIGTPDEIIEKIGTLQHAISLEMVVIHMFYGGIPRAKAENADPDQSRLARSAHVLRASTMP